LICAIHNSMKPGLTISLPSAIIVNVDPAILSALKAAVTVIQCERKGKCGVDKVPVNLLLSRG